MTSPGSPQTSQGPHPHALISIQGPCTYLARRKDSFFLKEETWWWQACFTAVLQDTVWERRFCTMLGSGGSPAHGHRDLAAAGSLSGRCSGSSSSCRPGPCSRALPALRFHTEHRRAEGLGWEGLRLRLNRDAPCPRPEPQLQAEPSPTLPHLAALRALAESPLLLCPQTGRMELHLHVMSAAGRGVERGEHGHRSQRVCYSWLFPPGEGADRGDHLSVHGAVGNSAARRVDGARVPWRYRIWEQFLGQKLKTSFLLIGG